MERVDPKLGPEDGIPVVVGAGHHGMEGLQIALIMAGLSMTEAGRGLVYLGEERQRPPDLLSLFGGYQMRKLMQPDEPMKQSDYDAIEAAKLKRERKKAKRRKTDGYR